MIYSFQIIQIILTQVTDHLPSVTEQMANIFHVRSKVTFTSSNSGNPISCVQHSYVLVLGGRTEKNASFFL